VIAASNRYLEGAGAEGALRKDLFYRQCGADRLPALCKRKEEIELLAESSLRDFNRPPDRNPGVGRGMQGGFCARTHGRAMSESCVTVRRGSSRRSIGNFIGARPNAACSSGDSLQTGDKRLDHPSETGVDCHRHLEASAGFQCGEAVHEAAHRANRVNRLPLA
jgi:hypothetical protein